MYDDKLLCKQFRMSRSQLTHIVRETTDHSLRFQQNSDCTGGVGISILMKCTSTFHQLAYDSVPDALDKYLQMGVKTSRDALQAFYKVVMDLYGGEFLRRPTYTDVEKIYFFHKEKHGFPVMFGTIDYTGWLITQMHMVLNIVGVITGHIPSFYWKRLAHKTYGFDMRSLVFLRIYLEGSILVRFISQPYKNDTKRIRYKQAHEAARNYAELAFDVLKRKGL
ncbi:hypothetical protein Tco_0232936 [Tanacetum coccineum]